MKGRGGAIVTVGLIALLASRDWVAEHRDWFGFVAAEEVWGFVRDRDVVAVTEHRVVLSCVF